MVKGKVFDVEQLQNPNFRPKFTAKTKNRMLAEFHLPFSYKLLKKKAEIQCTISIYSYIRHRLNENKNQKF